MPLGCRVQFVSSALIWQHFNPSLGIHLYGMQKKKKNRLSKIKKLTCVPFSRTSEESESSLWAGLLFGAFWGHIGFRFITCLFFFFFKGVCESHSCFEEKASTFVFFSTQKVYSSEGWSFFFFFFSHGQIESSLTRIQFESNPQVLQKKSRPLGGDRLMISFKKPDLFQCVWVSASLRREYQFCQWVNTPLAALYHRVICCNSDDHGWWDNTSPLLHVPSASPHILSFFPRRDCFLFFITPWHHRSIDILVLLCHVN